MFRLHVHGLQRPGRSPGQRFRLEQYLPFLADRGVQTHYSWLLDDADLRDFYGASGAVTKATIAARAAAKCAAALLPISRTARSQVLWLNREAYFLGPAVFERLAAARTPLVYDFDDAIWIPTVSEPNRRFGFLKNFSKFSSLMGLAHTVVAGNEFLASYARQYSKNVVVIPTVVDAQLYSPGPSKKSPGPIVIGWSGSFSTVAHLRLIEPVLERVKAKFGDQVSIRVLGDGAYRNEALGTIGEAWSLERELPFLRELDVGVMPLPDDDWSRGKCGLKALMYMAVGVAPVLSPVGVNAGIVKEGVSGFLPRTPEEWFARLCELIESADLREQLGTKAREDLVARYSVERWREPMFQVLQAAAG